MSHLTKDKKKLLARVGRIRGQMEAIARQLEDDAECGDVLRLIASARGAMNGLMTEVLEGHIRSHAFRSAVPGSDEADAAEEVIDVLRSYLR
jgi:DNA-binding FrmR family transcriptional regulator